MGRESQREVSHYLFGSLLLLLWPLHFKICSMPLLDVTLRCIGHPMTQAGPRVVPYCIRYPGCKLTVIKQYMGPLTAVRSRRSLNIGNSTVRQGYGSKQVGTVLCCGIATDST